MDIDREIKLKIAQHDKWNTGYVDLTMAPLTPPLEESSASGYRTAVAEYLPTPPASVSSEAGEFQATAISPVQKEDMISVRYASPTYDGTNGGGRTSYRRRVGRGGRTIIDRGGLKLQSKDGLDPRLVDRYKYDRDEDDDDVTEKYPIDRFDLSSMRYRAAMVAPTPQQLQARCAQIEGSASNPPAIASNIKVAVGPRVPSSE
jgi:enhancer of polycomb-like protein